ncbi:dual specificity protein kinase Ttk [Chiloscyllium plagiosum]|uniref:dual specificity protein kinase Ttk n=1 Tax=Chiloscyllium plagiosum TaxID=36176 RepID=UPI001CB805EF|nr:dual specificity protein kinase Ttk [Chiloscyllium plagiosum]XP_043542894.1 dual specificity protein kinase Ttk [Chiloscyllium plagiosum]
MEENMNESRMRLARLTNRLAYLRTKQEEANKTEELKCNSDVTDHTATIRQIMADGNFPEDWFVYLQKVENLGDPQTNETLLNRLIDLYNDTVAALSVEKHYTNECYARILTRFAELKVFVDADEAQEQFNLARVNCKRFAFVHIACAQFELNRGSVRKCRNILQKALDIKAKPIVLLEVAFQNLNQGNKQLLLPEDGDQENLPVTMCKTIPSVLSTDIVSLNKNRKNSDSSEEFQIDAVSSFRADMSNLARENDVSLPEQITVKKLKSSANSQVLQAGKVPFQPTMNEAVCGLKKMDIPSVKMQTCSSKAMNVLALALPQSDLCAQDLKCHSTIISSPNLQSSNEDSENVNASPIFTGSGLRDLKKRGAVSDYINQDNCELKSANLKKNSLKESKTRTVDMMKKPGCFAAEAVKGKEVLGGAFAHISPEANVPIFNKAGAMLAPKKIPSTTSVSKSAVPIASTCQTPSTKMSNHSSCSSQTPVVNKSVLVQVSTPHNFIPASQFHTSFPPTPATPQQHYNQLQQYGSSQLLPQLGIPGTFAANETFMIKERVYSVIKLLGTGGSSKVFQVLDQKKQLYAIKQVNLQDADEFAVAGYKGEIEYLKRLQQHSDKIIRLFDYEITENYIYMVMELGNVDLNTLLRRKKIIKPLERKLYWENMLEAVHTIHQHGIIHSDLKPANFLVVDGMLKLIDFGIANEIQPDVTSISKDALVGTLNFMAPETIKDTFSNGENRSKSKISPKSDVWSLGCILYYMTYGKTPFQHLTNHITKLQAITDPNYEIKFPSILETDLLDVLKKCLIRNPKERISIAALLDHPYVHLQVRQQADEPSKTSRKEMHHILSQLVALNSPNSITRATKTLWEQCNNGHDLDMSAFRKSSQHNV